MTPESAATLEAVPPSVAEWEDLLLRMEIMQRVLRNTLEEIPEGDPAAGDVLDALVRREAGVGAWLERVSGVGAEPAGPEPALPEGLYPRADRFVSLRARNFAMLQRRGLEVWTWSGELPGHGPVTAYQAITWLVAQDVRALAALRERTGSGATPC